MPPRAPPLRPAALPCLLTQLNTELGTRPPCEYDWEPFLRFFRPTPPEHGMHLRSLYCRVKSLQRQGYSDCSAVLCVTKDHLHYTASMCQDQRLSTEHRMSLILCKSSTKVFDLATDLAADCRQRVSVWCDLKKNIFKKVYVFGVKI